MADKNHLIEFCDFHRSPQHSDVFFGVLGIECPHRFIPEQRLMADTFLSSAIISYTPICGIQIVTKVGGMCDPVVDVQTRLPFRLLLTTFDLWLDALRFVRLSLRRPSALAAENLFIRKQLALYLEPG
jgi:hypothetical protein